MCALDGRLSVYRHLCINGFSNNSFAFLVYFCRLLA